MATSNLKLHEEPKPIHRAWIEALTYEVECLQAHVTELENELSQTRAERDALAKSLAATQDRG